MLPFKRILFPVDYSDRCQSVIPYVQEMTRHFSAPLTVVRAYGVGAIPYAELAEVDPEWLREVRQLEERRLREFVAKTFPGPHVDSILEEGEPGDVINNVVQHQGTDLVMMPTHGSGPVRRLLLGSVTAKVLHDVSAAVWTVAAGVVKTDALHIPCKSILCAVDFSEETEAVLRAAAMLSSSHHAQLSLVHVVEMPPANVDVDFTPFRKELIDAANNTLREWKGKLAIDAPHSAVEGLTADVVCREAMERKADLIVVGRGRVQGRFSQLWSRLYTIVRDAPCPVLSI
jgi:nucleotide-binding universal stress UspA family protein